MVISTPQKIVVSTNYELVNSTVDKCQNNIYTVQEKIQLNVEVNITHPIVNTTDKNRLI